MKLFEQLPERLHEQNPYFVPPFPGSICKIFDENGPFRKIHGELYPFLAYRDGKPVGRITAIVNRTHNKYYKDKTGFFGFFDFVDDLEVAKALVAAARAKLLECGLDTMRGPYSPTVNDEVGLLVDGFDSIPNVMMPFNPPYYLEIYKALGLAPARDLYAFFVPAHGTEGAAISDRIERVVERIRKKSGITVRTIDMKRLKEELKIVHELYNVTLDRNWGFVPMAYEEFEAAANDLKSIADPTMVLIAEKDGYPIGFSLALPNMNELMWKARRHRNPILRVLKFIWLMKTTRPSTVRLAILGVRPEYRYAGLGALFYYESFIRAGQHNYLGGELSWVEANNEEIIKGITLMGGKIIKSYRLYESPVGQAAS